MLVPQELGIEQSPPAEPHAGGRHTDDGVLSDAPNGSFATLLSPPKCRAAYGTMPHTLESVDQSHICRHRTLRPSSRCLTPRIQWIRAIFTVIGRYALRHDASHLGFSGSEPCFCRHRTLRPSVRCLTPWIQ
jgi:hypothetical protein